MVLLPRPGALRPDVKNYFGGAGNGEEVIAFPRGVGQVLGNTSPLLAPVLRGERSTYSYNTKDEAEAAEDPFAVGAQLSLVSTVQALNSARFTVVGAAELLEDEWFEAKVKPSSKKEIKTANREFAKEITGWTFNEIGVLKVGRIAHYLNEEPEVAANSTNPTIYRVKNTVVSSPRIFVS